MKVGNQSIKVGSRGAVLLCLLAAATAIPAYAAGFIDERGSAKGPAAAATVPARGTLTGDFSLKEWDQPAPEAASNGVALALAIIRLLPPNKPAVEIDGDGAVVDRLVHWQGGTRRQALQQIASGSGLNIDIDGRRVTVRPVAQLPSKEQIKMPTATAPVAVAQPMPVSKRFEVKLSDIKLSTAMNRWAQDNGVRIRWDADKHVLVGAPMVFAATNTFEAIMQALSTPGIKNSDYPLEVCEYPNQPPLLRITRQGDQIKDCPQ